MGSLQQSTILSDIRLQPRHIWDFRSSGILRSVCC